jgi:hypothetical protein
MKIFDSIGVQIPQILLPRDGINLSQWAVIACDQFTSQLDYWERVEAFVGKSPSTLNLIFPEVYLNRPGEEQRIQRIQAVMRDYLKVGLFEPFQGLLLVERWFHGRRRSGLMLALDLEKYEYKEGAQSLIRATEGTIIERLPPRMKIRQGAALELPHILVLIDDPEGTVIEPVKASKDQLETAYDFDLMFDSGHLTGYRVGAALEEQVIKALEELADPQHFSAKYGVGADQKVLLFATGDGNHSLAAAKAIWEQMKSQAGMDHPARYALVEIQNVHDEGLLFTPIHRLLFGLQAEISAAMQSFWADRFHFSRCSGAKAFEQMKASIDSLEDGKHAFGVVSQETCGIVEISRPTTSLPVGTLQAFLDDLLLQGEADRIDYIHGDQILGSLGVQPGNAGFYLPVMDKSDLFKTIILDGALPRKTFSMGESLEKRFYMESRKIIA